MTSEVLIAGKGLAAYNFAAEFGTKSPGSKIHIVGEEYQTTRSWFVVSPKMPEDCLKAIASGQISTHTLTDLRFIFFDQENVSLDIATNLEGSLPANSFLMVNDHDLKTFYRRKAASTASIFVHDGSIKTAQPQNGQIVAKSTKGEQIEADIAIDATGASSRLQREFEPKLLNDDPIIVWIYGYRTEGEFDPNTMIFPLKDSTTGRLSWIAPWSSTVADVIASDYCKLSQYSERKAAFENIYVNLAQMCLSNKICKIGSKLEKITGRVRVVPTQKPGYDHKVFAVGDAAGQACPNMAEGISTALNQSHELANALSRNHNLTPQDYYSTWRNGKNAQFPYDLQLSFLLNRYRSQKAGRNQNLYKAIVENGSPWQKLRVMAERKLSAKDIPTLARVLVTEPNLINLLVSRLGTAALIKYFPTLFENDFYGQAPQSKEPQRVPFSTDA